ncbi:MAG: 50S ribosomal protein L24 [Candidatus Hydrogenedentes bacterium]|nr:50S ribosomal protein L24 [Candidatus Hydrogenedentota bacterium]
MHIRKGDTVVVISGRQKGRRGKVLRVFPKRDRVLVQGVNMIKRHQRPSTRNQRGGIVEREAPVHLSKVMIWCEAAGRPSRVIMKRLEDGTRVRTYKVNHETISD